MAFVSEGGKEEEEDEIVRLPERRLCGLCIAVSIRRRKRSQEGEIRRQDRFEAGGGIRQAGAVRL
jgi:hypothetical protein